jgi:4-amino-4-deoxy-L-arabinose transferase-like glycosyltransferase
MDVFQASRAPRAAARATFSWLGALITLLIGIMALLPRVLGLGDFMTTDEVYHWISRVERFSDAIAAQHWAATVQTGHPGVTIMWLGSLGLALEHIATAHGWAPVASPVEHLAWLRLPSALLQALLVPLGYRLLRRLVAPATALVAALLWATSPYLIAHSRLLHLDALLTAFVTFSLLLLLAATNDQRRVAASAGRATLAGGGWALFGSGACAGLALLTKGPALILLPSAGLLLLWRLRAASLGERLGHVIAWYLIWLATAALVVLLVWPALWVEPGHALGTYVEEIVSNGGRPNGDGQFFLGRAVDDPGPLFYPIADLFRMTPATLLGLLALPLVFLRTRKAERSTASDQLKQPIGPADAMTTDDHSRLRLHPSALFLDQDERGTLLALAAFALFWTVVMTLGPKKFDRYVLPTWPALLVLSAAGWAALLALGARLFARRAAALGWALAGLLLVLQCSQPALYHPYYLSYYNPLLGGGAVAQRTLLIGWGEGMDQVGAYLRARPDIEQGPVLSALGLTLRPFVPVPVRDVTNLGNGAANYAVVYRESIQREANPAIYAAIRQTLPLHTVTIHGIDYAWIYQLPKPFDRALPARFGDALQLRGVTLTQAAGQIILTPSWDVRGRPAADYQVFLHLLDSSGKRVAQIDIAPGGGGGRPTSSWQPGEQIAVPLQLPLPANLPGGEYQLTMGLYDLATGARLPLAEGRAADPAYAGRDALLIGTVTLLP